MEEKLAESEEKLKVSTCIIHYINACTCNFILRSPLQVCQMERRDALEERDKLSFKLHEEKSKLKRVKEDVSCTIYILV